MDGNSNGGVTTEQILAILGAKEVEVQVLRQQNAASEFANHGLRQQVAVLQNQLGSTAKPKPKGKPGAPEPEPVA